MTFGLRQFGALLSLFIDVIEVPISHTIWIRSVGLMRSHDFKSYDAIHLATARNNRLKTFVTADREFTRYEGLRVWLARDNS